MRFRSTVPIWLMGALLVAASGCGDSTSEPTAIDESVATPVTVEAPPATELESVSESAASVDSEQGYNCLCTSCNHSWVSSSRPTKCPNCDSKQVVYN